jgi:hypothetical protein
MSGAMQGEVRRIAALDLGIAAFDWAFARERGAEIDAHFEATRRRKPSMWNGRVLLMHHHRFVDERLAGEFFETDFASFMAWRDFGFPDSSAINCFALGALQGADGAYVLGVMDAETMNAGKVYFPGGTPDLSDIAGGKVDLEASVRREIEEETGLAPADLTVDPGWHCIPAGPMIALLKPMRSSEPAEALRARILANLARQRHPELSDMVVVRSASDISDRMPSFIRTFLHRVFSGTGL